jgi:hypothetical protein
MGSVIDRSVRDRSVIDGTIVYRRSRPTILRAWVGTATAWAVGLTLVVVLLTTLILLTGRARMVPILSGSMEPAIPSGGLLIATPVASSGVRPGDIILYSIPIGDRHVEAHRIVRIVSRGDRPVVITKATRTRRRIHGRRGSTGRSCGRRGSPSPGSGARSPSSGLGSHGPSC